MLPDELMLTVQYFWDGAVGLNNWLGFALAAVYYVGTDYEFGLTYCEIMGYGYYIIDGLNYIVDFAGIAPEEGQTMEEAVAEAAASMSGLVEAAASGDVDALIAGATAIGTDVLADPGALIDTVTNGVDEIGGIVADATAQSESA